MTIRPIFAWYDLWVGFFWDSRKRCLYFFPVPCIGLKVQFTPPVVPELDPELMDALSSAVVKHCIKKTIEGFGISIQDPQQLHPSQTPQTSRHRH